MPCFNKMNKAYIDTFYSLSKVILKFATMIMGMKLVKGKSFSENVKHFNEEAFIMDDYYNKVTIAGGHTCNVRQGRAKVG